MIFVSIESPLRPQSTDPALRLVQFQANIEYARQCLADSIRRGECPFASHLLFPQVLSDDDTQERAKGLELGQRWLSKCDLVALYVDHGVSEGMKEAEMVAVTMGIETTRRRIYEA